MSSRYRLSNSESEKVFQLAREMWAQQSPNRFLHLSQVVDEILSAREMLAPDNTETALEELEKTCERLRQDVKDQMERASNFARHAAGTISASSMQGSVDMREKQRLLDAEFAANSAKEEAKEEKNIADRWRKKYDTLKLQAIWFAIFSAFMAVAMSSFFHR